MAAPRPYWRGYLKLSLVSCPIALYPATSTRERVAFKQVNKNTGNRLKQQLVDEETREVVETADKGRGYEIDRGVFMLVDDADMDAVVVESNHTIEIDSFAPRAEIDERYLESPYYLAPTDKVGQEAFAVIREAMRDKAVVALARVVLAKRERVVMLQAWDKGLMGTTLRYPYEVRDAADYFSDIDDVAIMPEMLSLADHIVQSKSATFDPSTFRDRYEEAVVEMLRKKQAGLPPSAAAARPVGGNVIDLMEALRRSLGPPPKPASAPAASAAKKPAKPRKRIEGQREMLLPIAGKGPAKEAKAAPKAAPAKPARPSGKRKAG